MLAAAEMIAWSVVWVCLKRILWRMLRNAKRDIVVELIALLIQALRAWGLCPDEIKSLVEAAYHEGLSGAQLELKSIDAKRKPAEPASAPLGMVGAAVPATPSLEPSNSPDRPGEPGAAPSTPPESPESGSGGGR